MLEPVRERAEVECAVAPERLWPAVSDTNRLNREAGLGEVHVRPNPDEGGLARHIVTAKFGPLTLEWAELPFEWSAPHHLSVRREVKKGMVARIDFELSLSPTPTGSQVAVQVALTPRQRTAQPIAAVAARVVVKKLSEGVRRVAAQVAGAPVEASTSPADPRALEAAFDRLAADAPDAVVALAPRLADLLSSAPDHEVARLRPYELAKTWGAERRGVLELCLRATVAGALDLSWDVVCPSCRTAADRLPELSLLEAEGHCDLCDLGFGVDLDRAVEASFRPSPAVRVVEEPLYCTGGPGATPHVVAQAILQPGRAVALPVPEAPGRYRLFVRGGGTTTVEAQAEADAALEVALSEAPSPGTLRVAPGGRLTLVWEGEGARHVKLEHLESLNLFGCELDDRAIGAITQLPALRRVYLGQTGISPAGLDKLRKARPQLQVYGDVQLPGGGTGPRTERRRRS